MYLEAVIVCVNYDDFLSQTLPSNKLLFDKIVVVTSPEDEKTHKVCKSQGIEYVAVDLFSDVFRMGDGISEGIKVLSKKDWVLSTGADMFFAPSFREHLEQSDLDKTKLYGLDRYRVPGIDAWGKFQTEKCPYNAGERFSLRSRAKVFHMEPRMYSEGPPSSGYLPCGYFQLWNPEASGINTYCDYRSPDGGEDIVFAKQWPPEKREVLYDLFGYHLESEDAYTSVNWTGRKSKRFE